MATVLIGHDATAYIMGGAGTDPNYAGDAATSILGVWKDIAVTVKKTWSDTTPSSELTQKQRMTMKSWEATLTNQIILGGGSSALAAALGSDFVYVAFTDGSGQTITLRGGVSEAEYKQGREEGTDTLHLVCVGDPPAGLSINYG